MADRWTIGELARLSGVTIRTLYYYDEIGLVPASERTGSGHRRYTEGDVRRLYRVRALTQLGLSLDEIARVLGEREDLTALRDLLHTQLAELDVKARQVAEARQRILGLVERLDGETMPEPEKFLGALELTAQLYGRLTTTQRDALAERRAELGETRVDALREEFAAVVAELREHLANGTPATDPVVKDLAARWQRVGQAFQTGQPQLDAQVRAAVAQQWREHGTRISEYVSDRSGWLAPGDLADIVAYLQRAGESS